MHCSSLRVNTLNVYFRINPNSKVIVDFSFDPRRLNPLFFRAIEVLIESKEEWFVDELDYALKSFPENEKLKLIVVSNDNSRELQRVQ